MMDPRQANLLRRIGTLWRSDWSGHYFDGRDGQRWIEAVIEGTDDSLEWVDAMLTRHEDE